MKKPAPMRLAGILPSFANRVQVNRPETGIGGACVFSRTGGRKPSKPAHSQSDRRCGA